ncbi:MAG: hypothetical protein MI748_07970 [Opitutales bacterium]|nr:hypothetical protein [Opitutales bacterium]
MTRSLTQTLTQFPEVWPEDPIPDIQFHLDNSEYVIVVLDDDPTGTQTIAALPVLTSWSVDVLEMEMNRGTRFFYILTNSRSLTEPQAVTLAEEIGQNLLKASQSVGNPVFVISRGDSTLRGHYPAEVNALQRALYQPQAIHLIVPFFEEGGRFTVDDVHYVAEGDDLVPAAETPFAKDASFGYTQSDLKRWVEEKTGSEVGASEVFSISLDLLRKGGPEAVAEQLASVPDGAVCIANAMAMRDVEVLVEAQFLAEMEGKSFIVRTAASYVRACCGQRKRELLTHEQLVSGSHNGGLIVVGSYVPKTTKQLEYFQTSHSSDVHLLELEVGKLINGRPRETVILQVIETIEKLLAEGIHVLIYTSRKLVKGGDAEENLAIGNQISEALVTIVNRIETCPEFVIAKGGITSSDIATKGLEVRRAMVKGQILPGVPVWELGEESRFPGIPYVVFPGNVGSDEALYETFRKLSKS